MYLLFSLDFNETEICLTDFWKLNIEFHENSSSGSWIVPCRHDKANSHFLQLCECAWNKAIALFHGRVPYFCQATCYHTPADSHHSRHHHTNLTSHVSLNKSPNAVLQNIKLTSSQSTWCSRYLYLWSQLAHFSPLSHFIKSPNNVCKIIIQVAQMRSTFLYTCL